MLFQGQVGPIGSTKLGDGVFANARQGALGDLIVSEYQPRYYEACYRGKTFCVANQAPTTTSVGLATTYTGLCLSNPIGSGVNLVIKKVGFATIVAFAAGAVVGLMTGYNSGTNVTHTTPVTPKNSFINGPSGLGLADAAATLPTAPTVHMILGSGLTGAITTEVGIMPTIVDIEGAIILPPGGYIAFYTSTASGASGFAGSFLYDEVPI